MDGLLCPECGCPEVIVYEDGTCECQGCGFGGVLICTETKSPHAFSCPLISDRLVAHHRSANG